ncbi:MAG: hypothetical protein K9M57_07075, partial [Phycisphaerae bacterium]|nr:hypothetical protein [Phycisphaerae bacterium]
MADYSVKVCEQLAEKFRETDLRRPMHVGRYDAGTVLTYEVTGVAPSYNAKVTAEIEKFVGGGFAGQVYRVKILKVDSPQGSIEGLEVGAVLAMKILIPPSGFSLAFRNAVYGVGFQGPFQLQVNPDAARAGALLQKFIRRAAKIRFGSENCVNDILGTFVDSTLGSCGEFSYWIDGRTWRLEVDDHLHLLKPWKKGQDVDQKDLGSPEYRNKFTFMNDFVEMLHEMGAPEFARQYEWSTCKSQPNCLKRTESGDDPEDGLVAVDFRAGLALLPFLPMSPGDFKLIWHGIKRGSLVQFDRGDLGKLKQYMDDHADDFADLRDAYKELERTEKIYRDSLPDITHNGVRLLTDSSLRDQIFKSTVTGWRVRNLIDEKAANLLYRSKFLTLLFFMLGILGRIGSLSLVVGAVTALYITGAALIGHGQGKGLLFTIAVVGLHTGLFLSGLTCLLRGLWGRHDLREHFILCFTSWSYFRRTLRGRMMERLILWHRDGRISEQRAAELSEQSMRYLRYLIISGLPVGLFRMVTDLSFLKERLHYIVVRPVKLYFDAEMREQWLRDMVTQGKKNHIITDEDANVILGQISEPYIQKYLKSLAVHVCTLPVTQIVSVIVALIYWLLNKDTDPNA